MRPRLANIWGVVVVVRSPYQWLQDIFGDGERKIPLVDNASQWDENFISRYSHLWRSFIEHWLFYENGPNWALKPIPTTHLMEGPRQTPIMDTTDVRYFLVRHDQLMKDPKEVALRILEWSKDAVFLSNGPKTHLRLLERADRCTNYGNVVGRMARAHLSYGIGPRFKTDIFEQPESPKWIQRRIVFDHTFPYVCALGTQLPAELSCASTNS